MSYFINPIKEDLCVYLTYETIFSQPGMMSVG
jgi:hypothetical protein